MQPPPPNSSILVSSCLLGLATRYDGSTRDCPALHSFLQDNGLLAIPVCPEQLAGLPTPRPKSWFTEGDGISLLQGNGRLCNEREEDVGRIFCHGARQSLLLARLTGCRMAILKQNSPSCGTGRVHRNGQRVEGFGVTAALLRQHGISCFSEEDLRPEAP